MDPLLRKICQDLFRDSSSLHFEEHKETKDDGSGTMQRVIKMSEMNTRLLSKDYHIKQLLSVKNQTCDSTLIALQIKIDRLQFKKANQAERIKVLQDIHSRYKNETAHRIKTLESQINKLKRIIQILKIERDKTPYTCYNTIFDLYQLIQEES